MNLDSCCAQPSCQKGACCQNTIRQLLTHHVQSRDSADLLAVQEPVEEVHGGRERKDEEQAERRVPLADGERRVAHVEHGAAEGEGRHGPEAVLELLRVVPAPVGLGR